MILKPVKTAAQCAAELESVEQKLRARIAAEQAAAAKKRKQQEDAQWRQDFDRKARELYLTKFAQSRLDMAEGNSGTRSTYSVLSELARAGVA